MASSSALYGIIGALAVVVAGSGLYIAKQKGAFDGTTSTASAPAPAAMPAPASQPAPPPAVATAPQPAPPPAIPSGTSQAEAQIGRQLVGDARRYLARGDLQAAGRALDQAERLIPSSPDVIAARRELRAAQQQAQSQDKRVDGLVSQARAAIQRHDYGTAGGLLDQAEKIDASDRDVRLARAELNTAQPPAAGPGRR